MAVWLLSAIQAAVFLGGTILINSNYTEFRDPQPRREDAVQAATLLSRLLGQSYAEQEIEEWALVCTDDPLNESLGEPARMAEDLYRRHLWDLDDAIRRVEKSQAMDQLLGPQSELGSRLTEFGRWVADAKMRTDFYDCESERTPRRLRWLEQAEGTFEICLEELLQKTGDGVSMRRPNLTECHRQLATLPASGEAEEPTARAAATRRDAAIPLGRLAAADKIVEVPLPPYRGRTAKFIVSPDGRRVAYVVQRGAERLVVVDGQEGAPYEDVAGAPAFSADSTRVAYNARTSSGSMLVTDGVAGPPYRNIIWFGFSPTGSRVAYLAYRDGGRHTVVDGREQPFLGSSEQTAVVFSPDAAHFAYVSGEGPQSVVVDGRQVALYDAILQPGPIFSPDSKRVAFAAQRGGLTFVIVGENEWPVFDGVGPSGIHFSPDSSHVAYIAKQGEQQVVVLDGTPGPPFDEVGDLTFSPDSKRFAYWGTRNWEHYVVVDGQASQPYAKVTASGPVFSPDSQHVGYGATRQGKARLVIDGKDGPLYDTIASGSPVFSPNSARVAYVATADQKAVAIIDGRESAAYDDITGNVSFSANSKRTAFVATRDKRSHVVVDGNAGADYPGIASPILFSGDSAHVAFVVNDGPRGGSLRVVRDGSAQAPFHKLDERSLTFSPDSNHLAYLAWSGGWRLVVDGIPSGVSVAAFLPGAAPVFDSPEQVGVLGRTLPNGEPVRLISTAK